MGDLVIMSIPYRKFKDRIKITKQYKGNIMSVYKNFVIVEIMIVRTRND